MVFDLKERVAVVTGSAQGLGLGIARRLAEGGALVVMADVQAEKVQQSAAALKKDGLQVLPRTLDIVNSQQVTPFFDDVVKDLGRLDILVNNAGLGQNVAAVVELTDQEWDRVLNVTLTGTWA